MGERKVLNKYFPPDFDPSKIPRMKKSDLNPNFVVRMMLPMSVRCQTCGEYMYKGKKFNSRKEDVQGPEGEYLGIKIFRFYFKCVTCSAEFTIKTDPKNMDYAVEGGVSRNFEPYKDVEEQKKQQLDAREKSDKEDPMAKLENKTKDSKMEMDILDALDEIKTQNSRNAKLNVESIIEARRQKAEEEANQAMATASKLGEEEELEVQRAFAAGRVKRLRDGEEAAAEACSCASASASSSSKACSSTFCAASKSAAKKPKLPVGVVVQPKAKIVPSSCEGNAVATSEAGSSISDAKKAHGEPLAPTQRAPASQAAGGLLGLGEYASSGSSSPGDGDS